MTRLKTLLPVLAVLLSTTAFTAANAQDTTTTTYRTTTYTQSYYHWNPFSPDATGVYIAGQAGGSFPEDNLDDDGVYAITLGWQFHPMIRAEIEGAYRVNDNEAGGGDAKTWTYMVNGYWDFKNDTYFTPYIGAGLGWAYNKLDAAGISESENNFAYQGIAGISYEITPNWSLTADYRYIDTLRFDYAAFPLNDYQAHEVRGGVRYTF